MTTIPRDWLPCFKANAFMPWLLVFFYVILACIYQLIFYILYKLLHRLFITLCVRLATAILYWIIGGSILLYTSFYLLRVIWGLCIAGYSYTCVLLCYLIHIIIIGAVVLVPTAGAGLRSQTPRPWGLEEPGLSHHTHVLIHPLGRLPLTLRLHSCYLDPILLAGNMHRDGHPAEFRPSIAYCTPPNGAHIWLACVIEVLMIIMCWWAALRPSALCDLLGHFAALDPV